MIPIQGELFPYYVVKLHQYFTKGTADR